MSHPAKRRVWKLPLCLPTREGYVVLRVTMSYYIRRNQSCYTHDVRQIREPSAKGQTSLKSEIRALSMRARRVRPKKKKENCKRYRMSEFSSDTRYSLLFCLTFFRGYFFVEYFMRRISQQNVAVRHETSHLYIHVL